jgi:hypothetical protein
MKKVVPDQCMMYHKEKDDPINRKRLPYEDTTSYHNRSGNAGCAYACSQGPTNG